MNTEPEQIPMAKTRFFRVALEGATTDGRAITRQDIVDMAETFERDTYGGRVWLEHFRGLIPGSPFDALGDVLSLKMQEDTVKIGGKGEKRLALYAEIEPLPTLVEMNKAKQKIYTSIEMQPNFANSGRSGFVGLAVTDSPASLGTEVLAFSSNHPAIFAGRKQAPGNLFTEALETSFELIEETSPSADAIGGLFAKIAAFVDNLSGKVSPAVGPEGQRAPEESAAVAAAPAADAAGFAAIGAAIGDLAAAVQASTAATESKIAQFAADLKSATEKVEQTPAATFMQRDLATGGDVAHRTDC